MESYASVFQVRLNYLLGLDMEIKAILKGMDVRGENKIYPSHIPNKKKTQRWDSDIRVFQRARLELKKLKKKKNSQWITSRFKQQQTIY